MSRVRSTDVRRDATEHGVEPPLPLATDLRVGTRLAAYELEELVGRGGMGVVYRARHVHLQRTVALKLLGPGLAAEDFRERFVREAQLAAALHHPNIVTVYDAGEADGLLYIAMQYVEGTDLAELLRREGQLEPAEAVATLGPIASALDAAHALGIVHRDVKPGNVLLDSERPYLTDFGLTKRVSSQTKLTQHESFVGTVDYIAPEQIMCQSLDARADLYSLACVLFHALTGAPPFAKDSELSVLYAQLEESPSPVSSKRPGLPSELDAVLATALAKQKEDRYESCGALIDATRGALGEAPPAATAFVPRPARKRVLIADDEAAVRAMIRVGLGGDRFQFGEVERGEDVLELVRRDEPELLFLDWGLPGKPAAEVCAALRGSGSQVIAVVSRREPADPKTIRAAGADAVLKKPFSSVQLLWTVGELLGLEIMHP
jgi:serine/threonine protein kinase/CheY-like chemotaxis protein